MQMSSCLEKKFPAFVNKYGGKELKEAGLEVRTVSATHIQYTHHNRIGKSGNREAGKPNFSLYPFSHCGFDPDHCLYQFYESVHGPRFEKSKGSGCEKSDWCGQK